MHLHFEVLMPVEDLMAHLSKEKLVESYVRQKRCHKNTEVAIYSGPPGISVPDNPLTVKDHHL